VILIKTHLWTALTCDSDRNQPLDGSGGVVERSGGGSKLREGGLAVVEVVEEVEEVVRRKALRKAFIYPNPRESDRPKTTSERL
jgi:hypothetical protein